MIDTQKLRQRILELAIRGKLVPQDPNDEPASVLLDRIRAEKERLIAEGKIKRPKTKSSTKSLSPGKKSATDTPHYPDFIPPFDIPASWQWVKLEDFVQGVTDFVASGSFSSLRENVAYYSEENYAVLVRTADFQTKFTQGLVYTDKHGYEFLSNSNLFGGELILPNIGASIGKVFIVPTLNKPMTLAPNSIMVKSWDDYKRDWLYFLFLSEFGQNLLRSINNSSAQGKFNKTDFKGLMIPIPGQHEMRRILIAINTFLLLIEDINSNRLQLITAVEQTRTKILELAVTGKLVPQNPDDEPAAELLRRINPKAEIITDNGHYPLLPEGWCVCHIGDVCNYGHTQQVPVDLMDATDWILELEDIEKKSGRILAKTLKKQRSVNGNRNRFERGNVLFSKLRTYLNKVLVAPDNGYCSTEIVPIRANEAILPEYLCTVMRSPQFLSYTAGCGYGVKMPRLSTNDAKRGIVLLPPVAEQRRIMEKIHSLFESLGSISEAL